MRMMQCSLYATLVGARSSVKKQNSITPTNSTIKACACQQRVKEKPAVNVEQSSAMLLSSIMQMGAAAILPNGGGCAHLESSPPRKSRERP